MTQFIEILPTLYPSEHPSYSPSMCPTLLPTMKPTDVPSHVPSLNPTSYPSLDPSLYPSTDPTKHPTLEPTTKAPTPGLSYGDPIIHTFTGECYDLNKDGRYLASSHIEEFDHDVYISIYNHYMRDIQVVDRDTGEIMLAINNFQNVINSYPHYFIERTLKCEPNQDCPFFFKEYRFDAQEFEYIIQVLPHTYLDKALKPGQEGVHLDIYPKPYDGFLNRNYNGLYFEDPIPDESGQCRV